MNTKRFTILHSNDMHGDFLAEAGTAPGEMIGGLSLLSGYINTVRSQEKNVIYTISGDMVQGSIIDSEYRGISTIEIMNYLAPDVASLGNHELDYGLPQLLFLDKMANFPIINCNMYIKKYNKRLFAPYIVKTVDDFDILFIGIVTEAILDSLRMDNQISAFITLEDAATEIGHICDAYKNDDIDLTVLLTHIGLDSDRELAALLKPEWGVDMMLGGHSHSLMDQPELVNNILIAQAAVGTNQIGRFDLLVDDETNAIVDWKWQLVPIHNNNITPDADLQKFIDSYKSAIDDKYNTLLCRMARKLTHPAREVETEVGNLFADIFASLGDVDVVLIGSGSIRLPELGPMVTLRDLKQMFPYDDSFTRYTITGQQLLNVFSKFMRKENRNHEGECYQVNGSIRAAYDDVFDKLVSLEINGTEVDPEGHYKLGLQGYHALNSDANLGLSMDDLTAIEPSKVLATSMQGVVEEYLRHHQAITQAVEGRLSYR